MDSDYDYVEIEPKPQKDVKSLPPALADYADPTITDNGRYHIEFEISILCV